MIKAGVHDACLFFLMRRLFLSAWSLLFLFGFSACFCVGQPSATTGSDPIQETHRALNLAKAGHCKEALPLLRKAAARTTQTQKDLKRQAGFAGVRCAMVDVNPDAATEFLRGLTRDFPHDPEVLYLSVHTYSDLSTRAAQELATSAPNSPQAHELNAEALEMQGKWNEAEKEYQAVLQQDPRSPGIHFRLGRLMLSRPNPAPDMAERAKQEFQRELEIDPNNAGAEYVLGELARQAQQWDEAIQRFTRVCKLDAGFGDAFLGLGSSLMSLKKFPEAIAPLETAVKLEPANPAAHYSLAVAYTRSGRKQEAEKEFAIHRQMMQRSEPAEGAPAEPESQSQGGPQGSPQ
jgi:tetratricopeptide (TPR) repeat protein